MNKIYHLSTCTTCQRILKSFDLSKFELQDIKSEPITKEQLRDLKNKVGNYESLFSRRAMKYRAMGLHERDLTEADYEKLILQEYTFLKRPVMVINNAAYIGNSKKVVQKALDAVTGS